MTNPSAFAKDSAFWVRLGWGSLVALISAIGTLIFVILMNLGLNLIWGWLDLSDMEAFSGTWPILVIMTGAGLVVGVIHHFTDAEDVNIFEAVHDGYLDPKTVPAALLVSLVSLVGGFSVGPEVPSGMWAGGFATWFSERRGMSDELRESNVQSGVVGAYGGLFTSPFAFVVMRHDRRHVVHFNVTAHPTASWTAQQIVEAFPGETVPRFLIRDRDSIYGALFQERVKHMGIEQVVIAYRSPWQSPYVERLIGSIRRECLNRVIVLNERHLRRILSAYFRYYHESRTHLSLDRNSPVEREIDPPENGKVIAIPQVGGLHHRYRRAA